MDKSNKSYTKYLKKMKECCNFYDPANILLDMLDRQDIKDYTFIKTTITAVLPIITSYVLWVLKNAEQMKIKVLYFLARDGHIMYKIASEFCKEYDIPVVCKYLYCSRYSLRKPLYFIDKTEAMKRLCTYEINISPQRILDKLDFSEEEKDLIFSDIGMSDEDRDRSLTIKGLENIRKKLESSNLFDKIATRTSQKAYQEIIQYFRQEGLFDDVDYAFVDSGWAGTTQRSIRFLLENETKKRMLLKGFYFGLYNRPKTEDGEYYSFYFGPENNPGRGIMFNNSLFECLCFTDHGMTIGYRLENSKWSPILNDHKKGHDFDRQTEILFSFLKEMIKYNKYSQIRYHDLARHIEPVIKSFMCNPSRLEAEVYGSMIFSDNTKEEHSSPLARTLTKKELVKELVPIKLYYKLVSKREYGELVQSYWIEGSISQLKTLPKIIFKLNNLIIYLLKTMSMVKK